jgi:metal-responsive CopG/Arc/MetJ family transcriptional regulator
MRTETRFHKVVGVRLPAAAVECLDSMINRELHTRSEVLRELILDSLKERGMEW